jgi:hypothetical protein
MTRPFILSASIADVALGDPQWAGAVLAAAEAAGIDLLVLGRADALPFDAQVIAAWAAARSSTVGIITTVPASTSHPFHVARALSAVDFLCDGRSGWMPLAGGAPDGMAEDMVGAARSLWDGWGADTLIIDKASGRYLDTAKVRASNYAGPFFQVAGPVNAMRPPQGHPLLVSDADSPVAVDGIDVALVREGQAGGAARSLLKVAFDGDVAAIAAEFAAGTIDGVHFDLGDAMAELAQIGTRFGKLAGPRIGGALRTRLDLPLNPRAMEIAR